MIIASLFFNVPPFQSSAFVIITTLMLIYLIYKKPIKKTIDLINMILLEVLILFADVSLLAINILDIKGIETTKTRDFFGEVILIADKGFSILTVIALFVKILAAIRIGSQSNSRQKRLVLMQLFFLPIQQGSFGFEQVQVECFRQAPEKIQKTLDDSEHLLIIRLNESSHQPQRSILKNKNRFELTSNINQNQENSFFQGNESSPIMVIDHAVSRHSRAYPLYRSTRQLNNNPQNLRPLRRHRKI